ncbi:hypothetical protein LTR09_012184 [Extremus antarcticus]|uniref:Uncharacterized protein n=1 Tax=Extremus antarcticus TaxID=702011 RepID=A0AAJ0G789_9PEZI|nr:hypothetical protein LTR09_012184 [Extremus antarcticus]
MDWAPILDDEWDAFHGNMMSMEDLDKELDAFYGPNIQHGIVAAPSGSAPDQPVTQEPWLDLVLQQDEDLSTAISKLDTADHVPNPSTPHEAHSPDIMEGVEHVTAELGDDVVENSALEQPHFSSLAAPTTSDRTAPHSIIADVTQDTERATTSPLEVSDQIHNDDVNHLPDINQASARDVPILLLGQPHHTTVEPSASNQPVTELDSDGFEPIDWDTFPEPSPASATTKQNDELSGQPIHDRSARHDSIVQAGVLAETIEALSPSSKQIASGLPPQQDLTLHDAEVDHPEPITQPQEDTPPRPAAHENLLAQSSPPVAEDQPPSDEGPPASPPATATIPEAQEAIEVELPKATQATLTTPKGATTSEMAVASSAGKSSLMKEMHSEDQLNRGHARKGSVPALALTDESDGPVFARTGAPTEAEFVDIPTVGVAKSRRSSSDPELLENIALAEEKAKVMARRLSAPPSVASDVSDVAVDADAEAGGDKIDVNVEAPLPQKKKMGRPPEKTNRKHAAEDLEKAMTTKKAKAAPQNQRNPRKAAATQEQRPEDVESASAAGPDEIANTEEDVATSRKRAASKGAAGPAAGAGGKRRKTMGTSTRKARQKSDSQPEAQDVGDLPSSPDQLALSEPNGDDMTGIESQVSNQEAPATDDNATTNKTDANKTAVEQVKASQRPKNSKPRVIKELAGLQDEWNSLGEEGGRKRGRRGTGQPQLEDHVDGAEETDLAVAEVKKGEEKQKTETIESSPGPAIAHQSAKLQESTQARDRRMRPLGVAPLGKRELANLTKPWGESARTRRRKSIDTSQEQPRDVAEKKKPVGGRLLGKREFANLADAWTEPAARSEEKGRKTRAQLEKEAKEKPDAGAAVRARRQGKGV